jgi:6-phosphogluconate dehydrogenase
MELALIGLGRMGYNMALRLVRDGHRVVGVDAAYAQAEKLQAECGAIAARDYADAISRLDAPRVIWLMVPAGEITEHALNDLLALVGPGDILIEGGNSNYRDSKRRAALAAQRAVNYLDCGTSGGIWGLQVGYCLMVGGERSAYDHCEPIFKSLAPAGGYAYVGASGAGHFAKMVHNGVEYGMMQSLGEGFEILKESGYNFDLHQLADLWNHGSVIRSWLLELIQRAFVESDLEAIRSYVEDSGEGRWTVQQAIDTNVPAPVITMALLTRIASRRDESFSAKVIAALRHQFGGHTVKYD